jgi:hypothetical protein
MNASKPAPTGRHHRAPRTLARALFSALCVLIGVGAPLLALDVVDAPRADAHCPPGAPGGSLFTWWGEENDAWGTCDWDNVYHGWLNDRVTDGSCVWSEYIDAGVWNVQAVSCVTGAWLDYWKFDRDGDFFSYINLCRNQGCGFNWPASYGY